MARRNLWTQDETKTMLKIMIDKNMMPLFENKDVDKMDVYNQIKDELLKIGFRRKNEYQIETRWKTLKRSYAATERANAERGNRPKELCPYYEELDVLLNSSIFPSDIVCETISPSKNKNEYEVVFENLCYDSPTQDVPDESDEEADIMDMEPIDKNEPIKEKFGKGSYKNIEKLGCVIKTTLEEANQEYFEHKKELIDHVIEEFMSKEAELDERLVASIKEILTENTAQFLNGLNRIFHNSYS